MRMSLGARGRLGLVAIVVAVGTPLGVVAVTDPAPALAPARALPALARGEGRARDPVATVWTRRAARLTAVRVDLGALGAHTHGNWILFRLPFDSTDAERVRDVRLAPTAAIDPDVSAARVLGRCMPYVRYGPLATWAMFTVGAVGPTLALTQHPSPPTDDPTLLAINVPTRVANYVSCRWERSAVLALPETWHVDVSWEER